MALRTSVDELPSKIQDYLTSSLGTDESFVTALPKSDGNTFLHNYIPWFVLTTDRLIRYQSLLWTKNIAEFHLSDVTHIEHQQTFTIHTWAIFGDGINNTFKTSNSASEDFISHLRNTLSAA